MAKQYLTVNGQLVMHNGKLIQVPDPDSINDLLDEQDGYATQLKQLSDDVSNLALNGLVDGTPRGSFQTLEQLQSTYPDGTPGIYVITKTGEWCYYNEGWKIGGNYIEPDSGGGASITANIKITGNKDDILGTTEHNKLCILSDTGDLSFKVVDKIEGGSEEISTLSEVLPDATNYAFCARYKDNIYIFGGANNSSTNKNNRTNIIYKFNCKTKTIETLSTRLPQILTEACCATHGDNIYIFGGNDGNYVYNNIYKFNCKTETISTLSITLPAYLYYMCCSIYNSSIYIFGGISSYHSKAIYKFNCKTETIETLSVTLPVTLYASSCSIFDDVIYILGGNNVNAVVNTIYKFNCTTESIETLSVTLPQPVSISFCCSIYENNIYLFGGHNGNKRLDTIYNLSVSFELIANNVLIYNANSNYSFDLITDQVTIPIKNIYIGNSNNKAQLANAYLYDETKTGWVNVNTGEVLS